MTLVLDSPAFEDGGDIPLEYTCDGTDEVPPLKWSGVPEGSRSFVLIVDDPDAPDPAAPKIVWVHWVIYNLPATTTSLSPLPTQAIEGLNDWSMLGYCGPCPQAGRHRYFFRLYALDIVLPVWNRATRSQVEQAMTGHILAETHLTGYYQH